MEDDTLSLQMYKLILRKTNHLKPCLVPLSVSCTLNSLPAAGVSDVDLASPLVMSIKKSAGLSKGSIW